MFNVTCSGYHYAPMRCLVVALAKKNLTAFKNLSGLCCVYYGANEAVKVL
jgi:hypothetical protein